MKTILLIISTILMLQYAVPTGASPTKYSSLLPEDEYDKGLYDPNLFEGDIEVTHAQFEKYYGKQDSGKVSLSVVKFMQCKVRCWATTPLLLSLA